MRRLSRSVIILLNRAQYSTVTSTAWRKFRQFGLSFGYQGCGHGATACFKTTPEPPSPIPPPTHTHTTSMQTKLHGGYMRNFLESNGWRSPHPTPQDYTLSHGFVTAGGSVFPTDNTFLHIRVVPHFLPIATKLLEGNIFTPVCQSFCSQGGWGVCLSVCWDSRPPHTPRNRSPRSRQPPGSRQPPPPPRSRHPPGADTPWEQTPLAQCMLGDTANKRAVRILLECILVVNENESSLYVARCCRFVLLWLSADRKKCTFQGRFINPAPVTNVSAYSLGRITSKRCAHEEIPCIICRTSSLIIAVGHLWSCIGNWALSMCSCLSIITTARQRSCRNVMFSVLSVCSYGRVPCDHYPGCIGPHCTGTPLPWPLPDMELRRTGTPC